MVYESNRIAGSNPVTSAIISARLQVKETTVDKYAKLAGKEPSKQPAKHKTLQELRLRLNIAPSDYQRIIAKAQVFLEDKKQVRFVVRLRGRERNNPQQGIDLLDKVAQELAPFSSIAKNPNSTSLIMVLNPRKH